MQKHEYLSTRMITQVSVTLFYWKTYQQNSSYIKVPTSSAVLFDIALASTNLVK